MIRWAAVAMLALAGCVGPVGPRAAPPESSFWPFAPVSLRIYALTNVDRDEKGEPRIVCHVELKDRWGDTTKGLGTLAIDLFEPQQGVAPGIESRSKSWTIDLRDEERNAAAYDPATRTYRFYLTNVPDAIREALEARERGSAAGRTRIRLRIALTGPGPDGIERTLRDEYIILM